jgi:epimerase transport system membrane fusion protein
MEQSIAKAAPSPEVFAPIKTEIGDLIGTNSKVTFAALAIFGLWAAFVPLGSAVVTSGTVISSGSNKLLQHRTGGIVTAIHTRDGDFVTAGTPIVELDPAVDTAQLTKLRARSAVLSAIKARLEAEKSGADVSAMGLRPGISEGLRATEAMQAGTEIALEQQREFVKGRGLVAAEQEALREKGASLATQLEGATDRLVLVKRQVALLERQHSAAARLGARGDISRQQVWDIESRLLDRRAELASLTSEREALLRSIGENKAMLQQSAFRDEKDNSAKLTEVLGELAQIGDEIKAAEAALAQTKIRAPISGTLVRSTAATIGGVVKPAETIAEIVPEDAPLELEASVRAKDIGVLRIGQAAKVKISALDAREIEPLEAEIVYISADSTADEQSGERYFKVRVVLKDGARAGGREHAVTIGMTGEVYLQAEPRTFLSYLTHPLTASFSQAFGEAV